ncbi:hypothetical protein LCY76_20350 [Fictibacillus sp. KIGAM418]|uniref:Uncharacterized protein n=1 Tax=Fictibacillus marinisediminis TaxID=2878389 RepID=A0A9X2BER4_9BACL|nr:hypothetical protein [Fictibacillus marinisediminis]MCK6258926.1 hypothetical protein [Fictibacillus marinisediminis]
MEMTKNEKAERLQHVLDEALLPLKQRLDEMEKEMISVRENQEELIRLLSKKGAE